MIRPLLEKFRGVVEKEKSGVGENPSSSLPMKGLPPDRLRSHQLPIAFRKLSPYDPRDLPFQRPLAFQERELVMVAVSPLCEDLEEMIATIILPTEPLGFVQCPA